MNSCRRQAGMSIPGMLVIAIMVGFFVMCGIRMIPHYIEYLTVRDTITTIAREYDPQTENMGDIRRRISTVFNTNQVYDLEAKAVKVYREQGETVIDANYEVRVPVAGRISAVLTFDDLKFVAGNKLL